MNPEKVKGYLITQYPEMEEALGKIKPLSLPSKQKTNVAEAITQIVIGQMLSRHAAQTIYRRVEAERLNKNLTGTWKLSVDDLTAQGVSGRKARSILDFGKKYDSNPIHYENWKNLDHSDLVREVSSVWGLSTWSADILAISYFGKDDIYPETDGTLKRAVTIINDRYITSGFDPLKAKPYRLSLIHI